MYFYKNLKYQNVFAVVEKVLCWVSALTVLLMFFLTVGQINRSPLFYVDSIEILDLPVNSPLSPEIILNQLDVHRGKTLLTKIDLIKIESQLKLQPWIEDVQIRKGYPGKLSVYIRLKQPVGILARKGGTPFYIDKNGDIIARVNAKHGLTKDLPVYSMDVELSQKNDLSKKSKKLTLEQSRERDQEKTRRRIADFLQVQNAWSSIVQVQLPEFTHIGLAGIDWSDQKGYRVLVWYTTKNGRRSRSWIDLGQSIDSSILSKFERIKKSVIYLSQNNLRARQIFADLRKKVVVKLAQSS